MNPKYFEAMKEIQHLATSAILEDQDVFAGTVFMLIIEQINAAMDGTPSMKPIMPPTVVVHDEPAPEPTKRNYKRQRISYPGGLSTTIEKEGRKLVGVIKGTGESLIDDGYPFKYYADVYENGDLLFSIDSCPRGKAFMEHVLRGALKGAAIALTHKMHNRRNRKARRDAAKKEAI